MLQHLQCPKTSFPATAPNWKACHIFQKECSYNTCTRCAEFLGDERCALNCPTLFCEDQVYKWREYRVIQLDNLQDIKELQNVYGSMVDFKHMFLGLLVTYKRHYFIYRWLHFCRKHDIASLTKRALYIQTDYGAQPVLDAQDKLNSTGHGTCVISCWAILHSPEDLEYDDDEGIKHAFRYYECDHVRAISPARGSHKDQDWFTHCAIFDLLVVKYKERIPDLETIYVWTDGAPNQYKCRQNFFWLTSTVQRHGVHVIHRFGATAQFKGIHDTRLDRWLSGL